MSISQLLSSDNSENRATYSPVESNSPVNSSAIYSGVPIQGTNFDPIERRNNGIKNLLNNDNTEGYQMDDSDTDTEDIPLIRSPKLEVASTPPIQEEPIQVSKPLLQTKNKRETYSCFSLLFFFFFFH